MINRYLNKKNRLILVMLLLVIIKQMLMLGLPIFAYSTAGHDDRLLMNFADSILKGEWLGSYSQMTLIKGSLFSLFLAFNNILGIPYSIAMTTIYSFACILFILGIKDLFSSKTPLLILVIFLLFNPISFADETFFRVYRSALTASLILIVIGSMFALYLRRYKNKWNMLLWALAGGTGLGCLWNCREDGIWIIPLVLMVVIITVFSIIFKKGITAKEKTIKCLVTTLPIILLFLSTLVISGINNTYYGVFTTNELNNSSFTRAIQLIYSVQAEEDIENVSVPRSTMKKLYKVSPTLNEIKIDIDKSMDQWSWYEDNLEVREVEDGWFVWSLREAVASAGYYKSAQMSEAFYEKVSSEIESGFSSGKLTSRPTMPFTLMSPWRTEYWQELPRAIMVTIHYIAGYEAIETTVLESMDDGSSGIRLFEKLTNNLARYPGENVKWNDQVRVDILNAITFVYQFFGVFAFLLAMLSYGVISILILKKKWRKKFQVLDSWLILSALLGSVFVLSMGVAYTDISAYVAISYWYLAGAYPLIIVFIIISMIKGWEIGLDLLMNLKNNTIVIGKKSNE